MADVVELFAGSVSPVSLHFATLSDLESVPTSAGWYAWFHVPSSLDETSFQLYRQSSVNSTVAGIFNLTFEGRLRATGDAPATSFGADSDETLAMVRSLFLAFAPPLYIGISNDLRGRLKAHRKSLQEFMGAAEIPPIKAAPAIEADSERESQFFGARIGQALRTLKVSADTLYVKCVLADDPNQLRPIEKVLNFALTPHYGRK